MIALRDNLDSCIGRGCLSLRRCAISNPGDLAAGAGAGAGAVSGIPAEIATAAFD